MAQIATVGALNPLAAEGAWGVVEAEAVAETEAVLLVWGTEEEDEGRTEELTMALELAEGTAVEATEETAVAMEETNDWETTSPVVPVMVKPLE